MTIPAARPAALAACAVALLAPVAVGAVSPGAGDVVSFLVRLLTALLAVVLLLRRGRGTPAARTSTRLFATALLLGSAAAGAAALSPACPGSKTIADALYLCPVPFAVAGLLVLPVRDAGAGARLRGLLDGVVAAAALAFTLQLLAPALTDGRAGASVVLLATSDVFVLATALSLLPRVVPELRRCLLLASCGLVLIGAANLQQAIALAGGPVSSHGPRTAVLELALLLIVAGALRSGQPPRRVQGWRWAALAPFLPTAVAVVVAAVFLRRGALDGSVGLALVHAVALLVRQAVASWDSARLVERLRQREHAYRDQALEDALTGLPNRRAFVLALERVLAGERAATLLIVDVDDFKGVNDTQGHDVGDAVLRHVGEQMRRTLAGRGTVARLGGDEFGVLLHGGASAGRVVAQELQEAAGVPLHTGRRRTALTVSIGGAEVRQVRDDASSLLAHADVALYQGKAGRSGGVVVLDEAGRAEAAAHLRLRDSLATPELSQFRVVYQPVFEAGSGRLYGAEALLRWDHPVLGQVSPAEFIPLAEQAGSVGVLGSFVLSQSLAQLAQWRAAFPGHRLRVGVNVSPHQLCDGAFAERALRLLGEHRLAPSQLMVEITEHAFVSDLEPMAAVARTLRAAGVSVAVDDFGTGYASLRYLECIPTDVLKIDRSYIAAITSSPGALALVRGVLALTHELGLRSIAEGVETAEQLALLRDLGCDAVQGHLLGAAEEPADFAARLAAAPVPCLPAPRPPSDALPATERPF